MKVFEPVPIDNEVVDVAISARAEFAAAVALEEAAEALEAALLAEVLAADALEAALLAEVLAAEALEAALLAEVLAADALAAAAVASPSTSVASAFASVAKSGNAARNVSARVAKFAGSSRVGGVGSGVIAILGQPLNFHTTQGACRVSNINCKIAIKPINNQRAIVRAVRSNVHTRHSANIG